MPRYRGTVTQSTLDWYAGRAQSAQQWFSQAAANYWAFTLNNNALDGTRLWVYDAEVVSGSAFPSGTGNPSGNPNPIIGYQGNSIGVPTSWAFVNENPNTLNGVSSITAHSPGSIVAGNLLLTYLATENIALSTIVPPDLTWTLLAGRNGSASYPMISIWYKVAGASEPATWVWGLTGSPSVAMETDIFQFSGNANPGVIDNANTDASTLAATAIPAPALSTTQPGDLIFCVWTGDSSGGNFTGPAGFHMLNGYAGYVNRWRSGWITAPSVGANGPFTATRSGATAWSALSISLRAAAAGATPAQTPAAPIQSVVPVSPGIVTLNFSQSAIGLAGISPENAAWGSLTWLAIK